MPAAPSTQESHRWSTSAASACSSPAPARPRRRPALLLVHGWGGDGREWSPHAEAPAGRFRVVVPDLRGHGRSEVPAEGNTPVETAADLAALIDALGTGPVVAVGHSRGGQVVNLPAVHHPHTVRTVIELDPAHGAHGEEAEQIAPAAHAPPPTSWPAPSHRTPRPDCAPPTSAPCSAPPTTSSPGRTPGCTPTRARWAYPHSEQYLRRRARRALTVWTSAEAAAWERGTRHVPGSRVDHWPGTGHYLHEEHPRRTVRLVEDWADSVTSAAA
ncbi:alpha/beta fold hydrolase [Streptomyces sp. MMG1533]|uniref:alpha/beta fold hydrolase n=1 Tax=Streptomyces sp. MMG1533 TaxID=1415546 RepID=UPI001F4707ED|nr:alpha/beta hydrolase [Streptomyces sp. MMG1533]